LSKQDPVRCVHTIDKKYTLEYEDGTALEPETEEDLNLKPQPEWGRIWEKDELLWKNLHDNADIEGTYYERRVFNLAVMAWEWKTKVKIREARKGEKPDIRNEWGGKENNDYFQKRPTTLYYAYFPGQGSVSGKMVGNDDYMWGTAPGLKPLETGGKLKVYDLQHTTAHELGHILGLRHEANFRDHVMWPYYNQERLPQHNDILRLQAYYGKRTPWGIRDAWIAIRLARGVKKRII